MFNPAEDLTNKNHPVPRYNPRGDFVDQPVSQQNFEKTNEITSFMKNILNSSYKTKQPSTNTGDVPDFGSIGCSIFKAPPKQDVLGRTADEVGTYDPEQPIEDMYDPCQLDNDAYGGDPTTDSNNQLGYDMYGAGIARKSHYDQYR